MGTPATIFGAIGAKDGDTAASGSPDAVGSGTAGLPWLIASLWGEDGVRLKHKIKQLIVYGCVGV